MADEKVAETVITARGELSQLQVDNVLRFLARQGLGVVAHTLDLERPSMDSEGRSRIYALAAITVREQYLVREHLEEFRSKFVPQYSKEDAGRALGILLGPQIGRHTDHFRQRLNPAELGLVIADRKELGFPAAPQTTFNKDAVQVGSFLEFAATIDQPPKPQLYGFNSTRREFILSLADHLALQMEQVERRS